MVVKAPYIVFFLIEERKILWKKSSPTWEKKYQDPCTSGVISNDASKTSTCKVFVVHFNKTKKKIKYDIDHKLYDLYQENNNIYLE